MYVPISWLKNLTGLQGSTEALVQRLVSIGFEVEEVKPIQLGFKGVVVAEVLDCSRHPSADRLKLAKVLFSKSEPPKVVVCGASNCRKGIKVAFAPEGALLPAFSSQPLKAVNIRGHLSEGMLCSSGELGLSFATEGILELESSAEVGTPLASHLAYEDELLEISIPPNRADCLSMRGLARELLMSVGGSDPFNDSEPASENFALPPSDQNPSGTMRCKVESQSVEHYDLIRISDLDFLTHPLPIQVRQWLGLSGVQSVSPCVDWLNYLTVREGQPMHAFDADKLVGSITVRPAKPGESFTLLSGKSLSLDAAYASEPYAPLLIADEAGPLCLAGVLGGERAKISEHTKNIVLEVGVFHPESIARTSQAYQIHTLSGHLYEKGSVDAARSRNTAKVCVEGLLRYFSTSESKVQTIQLFHKAASSSETSILLRFTRIKHLIGLDIFPEGEVAARLKEMGCRVEPVEGRSKCEGSAWWVQPPTWRKDLMIEEDLIEALTRLKGYQTIPPTTPKAEIFQAYQSANAKSSPYREGGSAAISRAYLSENGWLEAINFSFTSEKLHRLFFPEQPAVKIPTPLSDILSLLRTSLLPGLLTSARYNQNRHNFPLKLFEVGRVFLPEQGECPAEAQLTWTDREAGARECLKLAGLFAPGSKGYHWRALPSWDDADYFSIKGTLERLLQRLGVKRGMLTFSRPDPSRFPWLHPGQSAEILLQGSEESFGVIGVLHPDYVEAMELKRTPILFECFLLESFEQSELTRYRKISSFPTLQRELSFWLPDGVAVGEVLKKVETLEHPRGLNVEVNVGDYYENDSEDKPMRSRSISLILNFQGEEGAIQKEEVQETLDKVSHTLSHCFDARLRQSHMLIS